MNKTKPESEKTNSGFRLSVHDLQETAQADREKRDAEKATRVSSPLGRLTRLKTQADTVYAIKMLHSYDKGFDAFIHLFRGDKPCNEICKTHYGVEYNEAHGGLGDRKCDICLTVGSLGESFKTKVRCQLGRVLNFVGETATFQDEKTGQLVTHNYRPDKLIALPYGKNDLLMAPIIEVVNLDPTLFQKAIWQIERRAGKGPGKGVQAPKSIKLADFKKLVGRDVDMSLPPEAAAVDSYSAEDLFKLMLSTFDSIDWPALGLTAPGSTDLAPAPRAVDELLA